ncbi:MAG: LapA family protein [Acidimicrobiales bacterium]
MTRTDPPGAPGPAGDVTSSPAAAATDAPGGRQRDGRTPTRTSATYAAVGAGLLILALVVIFIAQNLHDASVHFIGFHFRFPVGLLVLGAAVAGGIVVLLVSAARVAQLRLVARRRRRSAEAAAAPRAAA